MGGAKIFHSLSSAHHLIGTYFLTTESDKRMRSIARLYGRFRMGLTFVACSCVRCLDDLMFSPGFDFDRMSSIANNFRLQEYRAEDSQLHSLLSAHHL